MRSGSARHHVAALALGLLNCAGSELPPPPRPDAPLAPAPPTAGAPSAAARASAASPTPPPEPTETPAPPGAAGAPTHEDARCADVPPPGPDGASPSPPPHAPLGEDIPIPGDRAAYVLPGSDGDARVIVYLHGMCGDVTAPDHFRDALRQHGTLLALRGDTPCAGERHKWRDDSFKIYQRLRAALREVEKKRGAPLSLEGAILFGYSQGADRAEKLAQHYPRLFPRVVLGGPPMRASPSKLARAERVAILGGELETTENMRAGAAALDAAGILTRYFTLECAYHGWYGTRAEQQLAEVLAWVAQR